MSERRTPIRVEDLTWLNMDRPNNLMSVSGLMWFREAPTASNVDAIVQERIVERFPVFSRRPVEVDGSWFWEDDPTFSLDKHLHHVTLDPPGDLGALQRHISAGHAEPLPKDQALWRFELINGVHGLDEAGPVSVLFARFHHAMADGIRLVQLLLSLLDSQADAAPVSRVGHVADGRQSLADAVRTEAWRSVGQLGDLATGAVRAGLTTVSSARLPTLRVPTVSGLARSLSPPRVVDAIAGVSSPDNRLVNDWASASKLLVSPPAPRTVWSGAPGVEKTLLWIGGIELTQVKARATTGSATVNDVLVSAVAGGLRRYLEDCGDTRTRDLPWMIPVALKSLEDNLPRELGNHFTLVNLTLPVGIADPVDRLEEVKRRMTRLKNSDEALMVFGLGQVVARAPTAVSVALTNLVANHNTGVMSNVPGPVAPMSLAGCEVLTVVGWNPTSGNQPISICLFSYNGEVTMGLCTDNLRIPDPHLVAHHLAAELASEDLVHVT